MSFIKIYVAYTWDDDETKVRAMTKILQTTDRFKIWVDIEHFVGPEMESFKDVKT